MVGLADLKRLTDNMKKCRMVVNGKYCYFYMAGVTTYDLLDTVNYKSWLLKTYQKSVNVRYVNIVKRLEKGNCILRTSVGFGPLLYRFLREKGYTIDDVDLEAFKARHVVFPDLKIILYDFQQRMVQDWINAGGIGVLKAPTGAGKSLLGCAIIKSVGRKALILVHTSDLLVNVWTDSLSKAFGPGVLSQVGIVGGGLTDVDRMSMKIGTRTNNFEENMRKDIVIATFQTLINHMDKLSEYKFGLMINDETHHCPANMFRKINTIVRAPYKLGLSVSGDTFLPIIKDDKFEIVKLEDLCRNVEENEIKDVSDENLYCFSFDENYKIRKSKIRYLHKYICDKEMFMVKLQNGRNIKITSDHSLFRLEGNEIKEVRGSDIRKGDHLVIPKKINFPGIIDHVPIFELFLDSKYAQYNRNFMSKKINVEMNSQTFDHIFKLIDYDYIYKEKSKNWYITDKWISGKRYIPLDILYDFRNNINPNLFRNSKLSFSENENIKIDCILTKENSKKLSYILGAFAGDGWFKGEYIVGFSTGQDIKFRDKICGYTRDLFNFEPKIYEKDNSFEIHINSKFIFMIFDMFGVYDEKKEKIIPSFIFYCDKDIRKEYINGLIDSDGYNKQDSAGRSDLRITNSSEKLIYGAIFLAHLEEDVWSLATREYKGGGLPHITAEGVTYNLWINGNISNILKDIYENPNRGKFSFKRDQTEQIISMFPNNEKLKYLISKISNDKKRRENILWMSKKDILQRKRFSDEEFETLLGRLWEEKIIEDEDYFKFKWTKQSNFCFADVKDVYKINSEKHVYDITTDFENFIGNGILCHNSATIRRLDGLESDIFGQLGDIQSRVSIRELINKGILAEPRFQSPIIVDNAIIDEIENCGFGGLNLSRFVKKKSASSEKKKNYIVDICKNIAARDRKFLLFTDYVYAEDVYVRDMYADALLKEGVRVTVIDQGMSTEERSAVFGFLETGDISGIVFGRLGSEGVNIPSVDVVVMANGIKSPITYTQRVGRAMRRIPGKDWCDVFEVLIDTKMELKWSEFNFQEYREEGFQKLVYKVE